MFSLFLFIKVYFMEFLTWKQIPDNANNICASFPLHMENKVGDFMALQI